MSRAALFAAFAIAWLPGLWLAAEATKTAVGAYSAMPFWDHWATVADYARAKREGLSWDIVFAQSNEHRIVFPRLIMFADLEWLRGRNILPYAGILASQAALLALFATIAWGQANRISALLALGVAAAMIASLAQWENLIWAFQVQFLMVAALGACSIYLFCVAFAARPGIGYLPWSASLLTLVVAAFSMANGLIAGAAAIGAGLLARFRWQGLVGQGLALALIAALYFTGYATYSDHGGPADALARPLAFVSFVAGYLGNPVGGWKGAPIWLGALGLALAAAAAVRVALRRDSEAGRIALVGIMAFVVGSAMVTALGRMGYGPDQAWVSRYRTFGLMFWAAQLVYWGGLIPARRPLAVWAWAVAAAVLAYPLWLLQAQSKPDLALRHQQLIAAQQALLVGSSDPVLLGQANWNIPAMMHDVAFLQQYRLSIFTDGARYRVGEMFISRPLEPRGCLGAFDVVQPVGGGGWQAMGWSWDVAARRPIAEIVLIDDTGRVISTGASGTPRPDVKQAVTQVRSGETGWQATFNPGPAAGTPVVAMGVLKSGGRCVLGHKKWPTQ